MLPVSVKMDSDPSEHPPTGHFSLKMEICDEKKAVMNNSNPRSFWKQLLCAFVINLVSLLQGASVSTSSIILHELQNSSGHIQDSHHHFQNDTSNNSSNPGPLIIFRDFHITKEEGSWIASSWVLGHLVSACFAGFISDTIGRRKSLLLDTVVFFLGFIILATGHLTTCLVLARALLGYPLVSQEIKSAY